MIRLSDFLTPLENFQYSINLEYDLNDENKISSFIPTGSALEIIEDIILSTNPNSKDRARILTGAYGKGKSHLTLTLLGMLSGKNKNLFDHITNKAKDVNLRIAQNITQYFASKIKLLPVLLNSQSVDLKATILQGLNKALQREKLEDLMPTTFFDAAIGKIKSWQTDYPKTYKSFSEKVDSVRSTIEKLKAYDISEYNFFTSIYPTLTSGSEFNPMQGADVITTLDSVVDALNKKGFNGIFIVYDEFSKFLDGNAETGSAQNIKLLQDIAERCNRSGSKQIHILLISHKNIENYIGNLPKKAIDDWKGISKRFKSLAIESSDAEIFEMISAVLKKDEEKFNIFIHESIPNKEKLKHLKSLIDSSDLQKADKRSAFTDVIKHTGVDFVEKCYPLHPYAMLLLPKVSELVAQNERTIFTFLASDERFAVKHFMRTTTSEFPLIEPDQIYDYFEPQFKSEPHGSEIRRQWQTTSAAIGKVAEEENKLAIKIIKAITLLYIVNQFDILPPSLDLVNEMYSTYSISEFNAAIESIRQSGLLIELEFKPHVRIREISGNNADELEKAEIERLCNLNVRSALKNSLPSRYIYPEAYNDKFEMRRYFEISFVDYQVLRQIESIKEYISAEKHADGYIFAVVINNEYEHEECAREIERLGGNRVIFALPKTPVDISASVRKYIAIQNILKREKNLTQSAIDELEYVRDDFRDLINNYIDTHFFSPEQNKTDYFYEGKLEYIQRRAELHTLLSKVCERVFGRTPVIINENINRENLSSPMKATRFRILESLLKPTIPKNFGLIGSQDLNVVRSIYLMPNIISNLDEPRINTTMKLDNNFTNMFALINKFINSAMTEEKRFVELYKQLKDPDDGIALRSGVIPFYIAAALYPYKTYTVIKGKKELFLTAEVLEAINENPGGYSIRIVNWDAEKTAYIAGIEKAVSNYVNAEEREYSSFNYIVSALHKWYLHLTRFDRETDRICNGIEYRALTQFERDLKKQMSTPEINAHEFLFERLPKIAGGGYTETTYKKFQKAVYDIERNSKNVIQKTANDIKKIFGGNAEASLCSVLQDYYDTLSDRTKRQVFSNLSEKLLEVIRAQYYDDEKIVRTLIKGLLGLRLEDFNDSYIDRITPAIKEAKEVIDRFNIEVRNISLDTENGYEISFFSTDGKIEKKHISSSELPYEARTFANEIENLIEDYGESMTTAQKAQVILEVMKKYFK